MKKKVVPQCHMARRVGDEEKKYDKNGLGLKGGQKEKTGQRVVIKKRHMVQKRTKGPR